MYYSLLEQNKTKAASVSVMKCLAPVVLKMCLVVMIGGICMVITYEYLPCKI